MALFFRKPDTESAAPLYTLGLNKTVLIVGLGNIGKDYSGTRHNIGFECVDSLAKALELHTWTQKNDLKSLISVGKASDQRIILAKPTTLMNRSGEAVKAIMNFYKIPVGDLLVVHDELDIPFGQIRTRIGGSSAGHNGIKSVTQYVGEDYGRVRIGIKALTKMEPSSFVLAKFSKKEQSVQPQLLREVTAIITEYIYGGELPHETRSFIV